MAKPLSFRSVLGDAQFDLEALLEEEREELEITRREARERIIRIARRNRLRNQIKDSVYRAQTMAAETMERVKWETVEEPEPIAWDPRKVAA